MSGGYRNRVIANDILDVGMHIATSGNDNDGLNNLSPTNNLVSNNHITNPFSGGMDSPFMIRLRGLGDRLSHNLIHDAPGQVLEPGGPMNGIDHNEIFNT